MPNSRLTVERSTVNSEITDPTFAPASLRNLLVHTGHVDSREVLRMQRSTEKNAFLATSEGAINRQTTATSSRSFGSSSSTSNSIPENAFRDRINSCGFEVPERRSTATSMRRIRSNDSIGENDYRDIINRCGGYEL